MDELMQKKAEIVERHMNLMAEKGMELLNKKDKAVADSSSQYSFGLKMLEKFTGNFAANKEKMLRMNGEQRLQYGEQWSRDLNTLLMALNTDPGYKSLMKDFDGLMKFWKNEMKLVNEELSKTEDEAKRNALEKRKDRIVKKV